MKQLFFPLIFLCLMNLVFATNYSVDFNIVEDKVLVDSKISFDSKTDVDLALDIIKDAKALSLYLDGKSVKPVIENNKLLIKGSAKEIRFNYLTKEILGEDEFLVSLYLLESEKFSTSLILQEGYVLKKPIEEKTLTSDAVFPRPTYLTSDGQRIKLIWERNNVKQGEDFSIFVKFKKSPNYSLIYFGLLFLVFILIFVFKLFRTKTKESNYKKEEKEEEKDKKEEKAEQEILKHLKEDEEIVINVLRQREGQCEQGTLRVITGFPKSTLSRILKELEDRKIIYKEKRGKKNLVFLK